MTLRSDGEDEDLAVSGTRRTVVTTIGTGLIVFGSAILSFLLSEGWNWPVGLVTVLLIIEGIDCLYVGITGRNGASPLLLAWWPTI